MSCIDKTLSLHSFMSILLTSPHFLLSNSNLPSASLSPNPSTSLISSPSLLFLIALHFSIKCPISSSPSPHKSHFPSPCPTLSLHFFNFSVFDLALISNLEFSLLL